MLHASWPGVPGVQSEPPAAAIAFSRTKPSGVTPSMPTVKVGTPSASPAAAMGVSVEAAAGSTQSLPPAGPAQLESSPQPFGCPSVTSTLMQGLPGFAASFPLQNSMPPVRAPTVGVAPSGPVPASELTIALPCAGMGPGATAG
jgi:hypothetical protein